MFPTRVCALRRRSWPTWQESLRKLDLRKEYKPDPNLPIDFNTQINNFGDLVEFKYWKIAHGPPPTHLILFHNKFEPNLDIDIYQLPDPNVEKEEDEKRAMLQIKELEYIFDFYDPNVVISRARELSFSWDYHQKIRERKMSPSEYKEMVERRAKEAAKKKKKKVNAIVKKPRPHGTHSMDFDRICEPIHLTQQEIIVEHTMELEFTISAKDFKEIAMPLREEILRTATIWKRIVHQEAIEKAYHLHGEAESLQWVDVGDSQEALETWNNYSGPRMDLALLMDKFNLELPDIIRYQQYVMEKYFRRRQARRDEVVKAERLRRELKRQKHEAQQRQQQAKKQQVHQAK